MAAKAPKKEDYKPSESDKANASVALAEYNYFKQNYQPLLHEQAHESLSDNTKAVLRGRAAADASQALTAADVTSATNRIDYASDYAKSLGGQLSNANIKANQLKNERQLSVLSAARKQQATGQKGLAEAARIDTSSALALAKQKTENRIATQQAGISAFNEIAREFVTQGAQNLSKGKTFLGGTKTSDTKLSRDDELTTTNKPSGITGIF